VTIHPCGLHRIAYDRASQKGARSNWVRARRSEIEYAARLRKVARHVGDIVKAFDPNDFAQSALIETALIKYSEVIDHWSSAAGARMVTEVAAREKRQWEQVSAQVGRGIRQQIETAPIGKVTRDAMAEQVKLIKSLPIEAAERVHKLAIEGLSGGNRASEVAAEIMKTGEVTKSRANTIARTEVGRVSTEFTKARSEHLGSTEFIWRTAGDSDVRPSHKALNGKSFKWSDPPECDPGHHALPGAIWNCRCYAEPVLPDLD